MLHGSSKGEQGGIPWGGVNGRLAHASHNGWRQPELPRDQGGILEVELRTASQFGDDEVERVEETNGQATFIQHRPRSASVARGMATIDQPEKFSVRPAGS